MFPKWEHEFPKWEGIKNTVRIISRPPLIKFYQSHADAKQPIESWYYEVKRARWRNSNDIKRQYVTASILKNGRVVFNICDNKYRFIVAINYETEIVYIRFIGTHQKYDLINAETI